MEEITYSITCAATCWFFTELFILMALLFPVLACGWKAFELELFLGLTILVTAGAVIICTLSCIAEIFL